MYLPVAHMDCGKKPFRVLVEQKWELHMFLLEFEVVNI